MSRAGAIGLKKRAATLPSLADIRIEIGDRVRLGPGKVQLLESVAKHGSITAAGRAMGMAPRHTWFLIDTLNKAFRQPVVVAKAGGRPDQRAEVTPFGLGLIRRYRAMEEAARNAMAGELAELEATLRVETDFPIMSDPRPD